MVTENWVVWCAGCAVNVADIADKSGSRRHGTRKHRRVPRAANSTCSATAEGSVALGRHEGEKQPFYAVLIIPQSSSV